MIIQGKAKALAVYVGESDFFEGKQLYSAIVEKARSLGLAGATVTRGIMGFGANSRIHTTQLLRLSEDLPMVVQIIDKPERIDAFLLELDKMVSEGMVVTWEVNIEQYRSSKS